MLNVVQGQLNDNDYKILLMCRVNPKQIRQPIKYDNFWILNPTSNEIRPYRILLKKVYNNSSSLDNKIKYNISPVDYIMKAIYSNDYSFYELKTDDRFRKISHGFRFNGYIPNDAFIIRLYSSIYCRPLNSYMLNKKILHTFPSENDKILKGFSQEQLNSFICCLQNAIKNNKNVEKNTVVYK